MRLVPTYRIYSHYVCCFHVRYADDNQNAAFNVVPVGSSKKASKVTVNVFFFRYTAVNQWKVLSS